MNKLQKELEEVFRFISAVPVNGENVEIMAAARERLRRAYQLAEKWLPAEDEEDDHGG